MKEDNLYLLFCYLFLAGTLLFLILRSKHRLRTLLVQVLVIAAYSVPLWYNLEYNSAGGSGLLWLVLLLLVILLHALVNIIAAVLTYFRK